jgi:hypothetical protein
MLKLIILTTVVFITVTLVRAYSRQRDYNQFKDAFNRLSSENYKLGITYGNESDIEDYHVDLLKDMDVFGYDLKIGNRVGIGIAFDHKVSSGYYQMNIEDIYFSHINKMFKTRIPVFYVIGFMIDTDYIAQGNNFHRDSKELIRTLEKNK